MSMIKRGNCDKTPPTVISNRYRCPKCGYCDNSSETCPVCQVQMIEAIVDISDDSDCKNGICKIK